MFKSSTKYRNQFTICIFSKAALFRNILPAVFVYMYMFFIRNISVGKLHLSNISLRVSRINKLKCTPNTFHTYTKSPCACVLWKTTSQVIKKLFRSVLLLYFTRIFPESPEVGVLGENSVYYALLNYSPIRIHTCRYWHIYVRVQ